MENFNLNNNNNEVWKGLDFWTKELEQSGLKENLNFFNDVIVEKRPPNNDSGYGEPVLLDVILDGKKCDVYHSDQNKNDTYHRLFIHIKE